MSENNHPLENPKPWESGTPAGAPDNPVPNPPTYPSGQPSNQPFQATNAGYQQASQPGQAASQPSQPQYPASQTQPYSGASQSGRGQYPSHQQYQGAWPNNPYPPYRLVKVPTHPVVETDYASFWRSPSWRVSKPILGLVLFVVLWGIVSFVAVGAYLTYAIASGEMDLSAMDPANVNISMTPGLLLATNISLAAMIPISMLIAKWIFGQKASFVSSVVGKIRWGWLFTCLGILLPLWVILQLVTWLVAPDDYSWFSPNKDTVAFLVIIILTTPLQCAGEEFGFRGTVNRCVASFLRPDKKIAGKLPIGVVLGGIISSLCFMLAHGSTDIWLNTFYFAFGFASVVLAYKTGGLEASIAMHVVNNLTGMLVTLPFGSSGDLIDRSAGVGDPTVLISLAVMVIGMALVLLVAKKRGLRVTNAPDARSVQANQA